MDKRPGLITPSQLTPLMPSLEKNLAPLRDKAAELIAAAANIPKGALPHLLAELTPRLRAMNSYYSNKIEGQHTTPLLIDRALHQDYSPRPQEATKQRLALAHIEAEISGEANLDLLAGAERFAQATFQHVHAMIYGRLTADDRTQQMVDPSGKLIGKIHVIEPGVLRTGDVGVGRHIPPPHENVAGFLAALDQHYRHSLRGEMGLIAVIAAHHRFAWVHPFADGNGRTVRLHTHLCLHALGLTQGIWSPMRGLARRQEDYYAMLAGADQSRRGDLDGRGNLTESGLCAWINFALDICLDQIAFMTGRLQLSNFKERMEMFIAAQSQRAAYRDLGMEVMKPMLYAMAIGPISRADFKAMTGLAERTAERALAATLKLGLLGSPSPRGTLHVQLSPETLSGLFPQLWPELDAEVAAASG
ncbi:Fic family protein [Chitinimonas arctica]|uniref:Fic family protein n=1 Tax=Chitinimonas arctica TaxID=2594795 RepID=A0A516SEU4_9NEIS|nr:Fic family protein [Chitinimonas arctica]QDQ26686.1 Fic family protein [Chitinimonas arctica]